MRRLLAIFLVFGLSSGAGAALAVRSLHDEAVRVGAARHAHRDGLLRQVVRRFPERPLAVFLGDSTIYPRPDLPAYPQLVQRALGARAEIRMVTTPGLHPFHYYYLMGPVLELEPDLVVLVANLRLLRAGGDSAEWRDLAAHIPARELLRAARLPLHRNRLTLPGLLLVRVLRTETGERAFYLAEGLRAMFQEAPCWARLAGARAPRATAEEFRRLERALAGGFHTAFDQPVHPGDPMVRMLGAAVEMATRNGAEVLVLSSPIPTERFAAHAWYDPRAFAGRMDVLRRAVEAPGGVFLDLHDALPDAGFRDDVGHFTASGNALLAERLRPVVARALGVAP